MLLSTNTRTHTRSIRCSYYTYIYLFTYIKFRLNHVGILHAPRIAIERFVVKKTQTKKSFSVLEFKQIQMCTRVACEKWQFKLQQDKG